MTLEKFGVQPNDEAKLLARLVSAYRKHLPRPDASSGAMGGRSGGAIRRVEEGVFEYLEGLGVSKVRDERGNREIDAVYNALSNEAVHRVFVTGDESHPPKIYDAYS